MIKLSTLNLCCGMYVSALDRPWIGTPFLFQSFLITTEKQIQQLQKYCHIVEIDETKSDPSVIRKIHFHGYKTVNALDELIVSAKQFEEKMVTARLVYQATEASLNNLLNDFRLNKAINTVQLKNCVHGVVEGVMQNPSALALFSNLKSKQQDTVRHCLNVGIISLLFARHLGFDDQQLSDLGYAALLHDMGEIKVSQAVLDKHNRGLTTEEKNEMEMHTLYGEAILSKIPNLPEVVIKVARSHHERVNGRGYPDGLKELEIDYFARLISIVDVYEIVTNHPGTKSQISCADALKSIYMMRSSFFDAELVEEFIKCLGVYPIGSVVELNNGEMAIVISAKHDKSSLPTIMIVKNKKGEFCPPQVINLEQFKFSITKRLLKLRIVKVIDPDSVGIDLSDYIIREISKGK